MIRRPPRSTLFPYNDALPISGSPFEPGGVVLSFFRLSAQPLLLALSFEGAVLRVLPVVRFEPCLWLPSSCVCRLAHPQMLTQGLGRGFQNEAAITASIQVPLDLTFHARRELPFQVPANQMDGVPAIHSCPTSSGPAWVGPFSVQHGAVRHSEKLFKLGHSGLASPHLSSPCLPHAAACHPDRSGGISPLFFPSRHPDPVGASWRQRSEWPTGGTLRLWLPRRKPKRSRPRELRARRGSRPRSRSRRHWHSKRPPPKQPVHKLRTARQT